MGWWYLSSSLESYYIIDDGTHIRFGNGVRVRTCADEVLLIAVVFVLMFLLVYMGDR